MFLSKIVEVYNYHNSLRDCCKRIVLFAIINCCLFWSPAAFADLTINIIAVNGAETEIKEIPIKYYLPKELSPADILESDVLEIDYDINRGAHFLYGKFEFQPKETRTFKIKVKDVWVITPEEIDIIKKQMNENLFLLEGNESYDAAKSARDKISEQLDYILGQQQSYSENIGRRIEEYRAYEGQLADIKEKSFALHFLEYESKALQDIEENKTVKFIIQVKNPASTEKTVKHKHYLPEEVRSEDIIEKFGFDVRFDEARERAFLFKEEIFEPLEEKKYDFIIKDKWQFPISRIVVLQEQAEKAMKELKNSIYAESGQYLFDSILEKVRQIIESKAGEVVSIKQHIGKFRVNEKWYAEAKEDLLRLEQLLAVVRAKKLEQLEGSKVKNVLHRLKALRGLAALSEAVFKRGISITMTWRIIFGTIIFVAFFTAINFFIWARRSGGMGEENRGVKKGEDIKEVPKPGTESKEKEEDT